MHACLLEIHGIRGSALVTCLGIRVFLFPAILAVTQHYTHPGSRPHLSRQQRVILGPVVDLDEPGVAAALSSSCTRVFRSRWSQGHRREAVSWRGPVVAATVRAGSCAVTAALVWAVISSCPCQPFPLAAWLWPAALWAQHIPSLIPTTALPGALGNTWRRQPVFHSLSWPL